jgi:hypothetical protein
MKKTTQFMKRSVVAVILLVVAFSAFGADARTLPKTQVPKRPTTVQPQIKELHPALMVPTDLAKMTQSLDRTKAIKTKSLVMMNEIKALVSETTAIIDSCPTTNSGNGFIPLGNYTVYYTSELNELKDTVGSSGSCDHYLPNVTIAEGNCGRHLDNMAENKEAADEVKKNAVSHCSSKQGIAQCDKQSLKNTLDQIKAVSTGDAAGIDTLIARIEKLIAQYKDCLKSKNNTTSASDG